MVRLIRRMLSGLSSAAVMAAVSMGKPPLELMSYLVSGGISSLLPGSAWCLLSCHKTMIRCTSPSRGRELFDTQVPVKKPLRTRNNDADRIQGPVVRCMTRESPTQEGQTFLYGAP